MEEKPKLTIERALLIAISGLWCCWLIFAWSALNFVLSEPILPNIRPTSWVDVLILSFSTLIHLQPMYPWLQGNVVLIGLYALAVGLLPLAIWALSVRLILQNRERKLLLWAGLPALILFLICVTVVLEADPYLYR
jgi:hypothetical protein